MYATPPATERERAVAALGAGRPHATLYRWRPKSSHGWTVRTRRAPIIENSKLSMSAYSQGAWKRELGLTLFAGQHLPSHLFGGNSLELRHNASGVRVSFCALEALRAWAALQHPPVPHRATHAPPAEWDYTFTTNYPGATAVAALGQGMPAQPDGASFYSRPAVDLARGQAQLRRPLCKCRGTNGRAPLVSVGPAARDAASAIAPQAAEFEEAEAAVEQSAAVPPPWLPTQQAVELDSLLLGVTVPLFDDKIDLARRRIKMLDAYDVFRQQVGRERNAAELDVRRLGQGLEEQRLRETRNTFEQHMPSGKQAGERQAHLLVHANDALAHLGFEVNDLALHFLQHDVPRLCHALLSFSFIHAAAIGRRASLTYRAAVVGPDSQGTSRSS